MRGLRLTADNQSVIEQYYELLDNPPDNICNSCLFLKSRPGQGYICLVPYAVRLEQVKNPEIAFRTVINACSECFKGMSYKVYKDLGWKIVKRNKK